MPTFVNPVTVTEEWTNLSTSFPLETGQRYLMDVSHNMRYFLADDVTGDPTDIQDGLPFAVSKYGGRIITIPDGEVLWMKLSKYQTPKDVNGYVRAGTI